MTQKTIDQPTQESKAVQWVKSVFGITEVSPLGADVANLIHATWGIHHFGNRNLKETDWSNNHHVIIRYDKPMSTVDTDYLTILVVLCHEYVLRMEISGRAKGYLQLIFHKRVLQGEEGWIYNYCPDIKTHVDAILGRNQ